MEHITPMAMVKGLSKIGSSYSIILDKAIMQLLDITPETKLEIRTDGRSLIMTPILAEEAYDKLDPKLKDAFESSLAQYGEIYKKLAQ